LPDINDFKLIAQKSERYYSLLANTLGINKVLKTKERERLGFYLFILENITGIQDISDLTQLVTDTDFNITVFGGRKTEGYGVDAIYIDDEDCSISVFNFKYRENFKPGQQQTATNLLFQQTSLTHY
jgi:hypothetical protein